MEGNRPMSPEMDPGIPTPLPSKEFLQLSNALESLRDEIRAHGLRMSDKTGTETLVVNGNHVIDFLGPTLTAHTTMVERLFKELRTGPLGVHQLLDKLAHLQVSHSICFEKTKSAMEYTMKKNGMWKPVPAEGFQFNHFGSSGPPKKKRTKSCNGIRFLKIQRAKPKIVSIFSQGKPPRNPPRPFLTAEQIQIKMEFDEVDVNPTATAESTTSSFPATNLAQVDGNSAVLGNFTEPFPNRFEYGGSPSSQTMSEPFNAEAETSSLSSFPVTNLAQADANSAVLGDFTKGVPNGFEYGGSPSSQTMSEPFNAETRTPSSFPVTNLAQADANSAVLGNFTKRFPNGSEYGGSPSSQIMSEPFNAEAETRTPSSFSVANSTPKVGNELELGKNQGAVERTPRRFNIRIKPRVESEADENSSMSGNFRGRQGSQVQEPSGSRPYRPAFIMDKFFDIYD